MPNHSGAAGPVAPPPAQGEATPTRPLTQGQTAQLLGVHPSTVRCWLRAGTLPSLAPADVGAAQAILNSDHYLTHDQAAQILGVDPRTLSRQQDNGVLALDAVRTVGGRRRYRRADVEALRAELGDNPPGDGLLTPRQAATMLGVTTNWLAQLADAHTLDPVRTAGGHRRYSRAEIEAFRAQRETAPADGLLTTRQAADMLGVDQTTVRRWVAAGQLTYHPDDIHAWRVILNSDRYLTQKAAARMLGVDPRTVSRWARDGVLTASVAHTPGGRSLYSRADIEAFRAELGDNARGGPEAGS